MTTIRNRVTLFFLLVALILALMGCREAASYNETFDAPGTWRVGNDADAIGQVVDGVYDLLVEADDVIIWTAAGEEFGDGFYRVEATQVAGPLNNGYGLVFRLDDDNDNFYLFKISGDGYVWIGRYQNSNATKLEPLVGEWWFESTAVQQGLDKTNVLAVRAENGNMIFYVNDQEVGRVTDNTFRRGDIGLMVETLGLGGVQVQFDNFTVTPLSEGERN